MSPSSRVITVWRSADAVCFDMDSTLVREEMIDELARFKGVYDQIQSLTVTAMSNINTSFRESLTTRLQIINPNRDQLATFCARYKPTLSKSVDTLVDLLQSRGTAVYIVTGGLYDVAVPLATRLGIPADHVFANRLVFNDQGDYLGFEHKQFTSDSMGKARVMSHLKSVYNYRNLIMIGDGTTDLEAAPPADLFIGYGGVQVRPAVKAGAPWFVEDIQELIDVIQKL